MYSEDLYEKIKHGIIHIHDDIFPHIDVDEVLNREDKYVHMAIDKYVQYFNYYDSKEQYNLKFCFKTTIQDLNRFYEFQEQKLDSIKNNDMMFELEHNVNEHIYEEVISCQQKVNRLYYFNLFTTYLLAFLLIFVITEITHVLHLDTLMGTTILALIMALVKMFIDKRYLEVVRKKVGWNAYRRAVKRSLAFYFASVVILNHCQHTLPDMNDQEKLMEMKAKVHDAIDILLEEIL